MQPNMRRKLSGAFTAVDLGNGAWRFSQRTPAVIDVYLTGAPADAGEVLRGGGTVNDIEIAWGERTVSLNFGVVAGRHSLETASAIVHEPKPHLYDALPLATFEPKARRFWRRVFRVVQIPGGRHLLGIFARRR
jgi:hypothetical protein